MGTGRNCNAAAVAARGRREVMAGAEVIAFADVMPMMLRPPTGANLAEVSVEGGPVRWTTAGEVPSNGAHWGHRAPDGARIELESASEVAGFQLIGLPGQSGTIYVEYFTVPADGENNV